jgi:CRP-like cAMP-binding protein
LTQGEVLFHQGDPGDELVIVKSGKLAIYVPLPGQPAEGQAIRIFQSGELFGEMAIIDQKPRSLSARAEEASTILTLSGAEFRKLIQANPELAVSVMAGLSDRIRYTTDFLAEVRNWVQRMTEGNYDFQSAPEPGGKYQDKTLATLAAEFARMAAQVKQREETLRQEVAQLRIEIDDAKRKKDASQIMDSEYYRNLKDKVKSMREKK